MLPTLATCSYNEYRPEMGAAVRISIGTPRWFPHRITAAWDSAMPDGYMLSIKDEGTYRRAYVDKLNALGYDRLRREVSTLNDLTGRPDTLVLLCFEKLSLPGRWCHRTMFAQWWNEHSDTPIVELGSLPAPPPEPENTLF